MPLTGGIINAKNPVTGRSRSAFGPGPTPLAELLRALPEYDQARQVLEEELMRQLVDKRPALARQLRAVFADADAAVNWLMTPHGPDGRCPLGLLETGEPEAIEKWLDEMKH